MAYDDVIAWAEDRGFEYDSLDTKDQARKVLDFINQFNQINNKESLHFKFGSKSSFLSGISSAIEVSNQFIKIREKIAEEERRLELEAQRDAEAEAEQQREVDLAEQALSRVTTEQEEQVAKEKVDQEKQALRDLKDTNRRSASQRARRGREKALRAIEFL